MTELYHFQRLAIHKIDRLNGRCLLAHEMGLGKSLMSLTWAYENQSIALPAIVVCPASIKWSWERQCSEHLNVRCDVLEGRKPKRRRIGKPAPITIVNWDILKDWLEILKGTNPQTIILDEIHYGKSREAQRTKAAKALCEFVPYVLALSGTPILNRPAELWPVLNMLRPDLFGSFMAYAMRHCQPRKTRWGWQYKGAARLPELHRTLKREVMCRCKKEDVLDQLPPKARNIVLLELSNRKEYMKAENDFIRWLRTKSPHKAKKASYAEHLVKRGYLRRLTAELKLRSALDWLEAFYEESDEKIIVFGWHKSIMEALHAKYPKQSAIVTGKTKGVKRQEAFDQFLQRKSCRFLFGNLLSAGVGWSAKGVSSVAFVELGDRPADHTQAEDRTHGIGRGQENIQSTSWWLIGRGTIEERLCELLQTKQGILDATLDGKEGDSSLDVFDRLEQEILQSRFSRT